MTETQFVSAESSTADDLLIGARKIADFMKPMTPRQVYQVLETPGHTMPIWKEPGLGIVSTRGALDRWRRERAESAARRGAA